LFSIDLEDIRLRLDNPSRYEERVPLNTHRFLDWLRRIGQKCTFFVTGDMAELYPSLIGEIASQGHEVACHTYDHIPLDKQTPSQFKRDLEKNISALLKAGAVKVEGFRAPIFSLTSQTQWAYQVLADLGLVYSSSVLPARNPFYGWEDFGFKPRRMPGGILEIPVTMGHFGPLVLPAVGGVYFRALPFPSIKRIVRRCQREGIPLVSYFHPYDIDAEQERYMTPGINESRFYNFLMYFNRSKVFERLDGIMRMGFPMGTYSEYVEKLKSEMA